MITARPQAPWFISHAPGMGTLARFATDTFAIAKQLSQLREAGAGGVSLSPWIEHPDPNYGIPFDYDFGPILNAIKAAGLNWVQIAPQFYGATDPRKNQWSSADLAAAPGWYLTNWLLLSRLPGALTAAGLDGIIDICTECNDVYAQNHDFQLYVKRLWVDASGSSVAPYFGCPSWQYTMSFIPGPALQVLPDVFQGNPPAVLMPHCYSNEPTLYQALREVSDAVSSLASGDWILGETDTLQPGDEPIAQQLAQFVQETKTRVLCVCPWPVTPRTILGASLDDPACVPPRVSVPWQTAGC